MMSILAIFSILATIKALQVYQELQDVQLTPSLNIMKCEIFDKIDYFYLSSSQSSVNYQFQIRESHYAVDIFVDFYLRGDFVQKPINVLLDNILIDQYQVQTDNSVPFCDSQKTQAITYFKNYIHYQQDLNLAIQLEDSNSFSLGLRNIQIIPKQCHESCAECVGPNKNQCRSCYMGAQLSKKTNECKCPSETPYLSLKQDQCLNKCESDEYFDENLQMCIQDDKMEQMQLYFWNTYDYSGWSIIENDKITSLVDKFYININEKGVGKFFQDQSISYKFNNAFNYHQLRIRANIFIFKSQVQPQIYIKVNNIKKSVYPLHVFNETQAKGYLLYHIDYKIDALSISNIIISVSSDQNLQWGINEIILNTINCQANCNQCKSKLYCNACKDGYYLYQGKCVTSCPNYSTQENQVCKDSTEQFPYTSYIFRAFDDNLISNFMIKNTRSINSFYQNQFGTFYNGVRYFGGLKDTGNQYYNKQFNKLPPHYNLKLQFKLMTFEINSQTYITNKVQIFVDKVELPSILSSVAEIPFETDIPHKSSNLSISMLSVPKPSTYFSFGISKLNIMIQRCYPLCKTCKGPNQNDCSEWIIEQNSLNQECNSGFIFDIELQKCILCPLGCQKCSDKLTCLKCDDAFTQQGSSCYCLNGYIDEFTLDCLPNPSNP